MGNTASPNCPAIMDIAHSIIVVPYASSAGVRNGINLSSFNFTQAEFDALCAQSDRSLRWRPVNTGHMLENVEDERDDDKYKEYPSGSKYFVQDGMRHFKAIIPKADVSLQKFFDSTRCEKVGVYVVGRDGQLMGNKGTNGYLYPFRVLDNSMGAKFVKPKDGEIQELMVMFDFDSLESDDDIGMINLDEMQGDPRTLAGLYDAYGIFSSITTTGFVVDLRTYVGSPLNPNRVTGLLIGGFTLTNRNTGATITITSVTENAVTPGIYTFVIPAQTSGHKLKLVFTKTGYDSNVLSTYKIIIP